MAIVSVGIDLGKNIVDVHGVEASGKPHQNWNPTPIALPELHAQVPQI